MSNINNDKHTADEKKVFFYNYTINSTLNKLVESGKLDGKDLDYLRHCLIKRKQYNAQRKT